MAAQGYVVARTFLLTEPNVVDPNERTYVVGQRAELDTENVDIAQMVVDGILVEDPTWVAPSPPPEPPAPPPPAEPPAEPPPAQPEP